MFASRTAGLAVTLALSVLLVTGCARGPESAAPDQTPAGPTTSAPAPEPPVDAEPEPADAPGPTCETLIGASVVESFESVGWTAKTEPFYIGSLEVPDGIRCVWADFERPAGDHGQMFGWAAISPPEATAAQNELLSQGWIREDAANGVYVTESPDTTIAADADGYGMTYLFTDGQVYFADTKQGLLLIEWPQG